jgi:tryptophan synthase beta chain
MTNSLDSIYRNMYGLYKEFSMQKGRFGIYGGQYIPETLMPAILELEEAYERLKDDPVFKAELSELYTNYAGRPSLLTCAENMSEDLGGARIYLKREDLNHTGSHKIKSTKPLRGGLGSIIV